MKNILPRRKSSTPHYQTFPTSPPHSAGPKPLRSISSAGSSRSNLLLDSDGGQYARGQSDGEGDEGTSPIPKKQLVILAIISLAEQTTLNSIAPYLPDMVGSFEGVEPERVGVLVGAIASAFAGAQFATNFFWGKLSDRIGRKPVVLMSVFFTMGNFLAFGFCRTMPQAIAVQVLMGAGNGNQALISTMLGEITDQSNQGATFKYLPVVYGFGGIIGPIIGGLLVGPAKDPASKLSKYPYLLPNLVCAAITFVELILAAILLDETHEGAKELLPLVKRIKHLFSWLWQFTSFARHPTYLRRGRGLTDDDNADDDDSTSLLQPLIPDEVKGVPMKEYLTRNITLLLITFTIFSLSNVTFNSLYPIFISSAPPAGRGLSPKFIGVTLSYSSAVSIVVQLLFFDSVRTKLGNKLGYSLGIFIVAAAFFLMPFISFPDTHNVIRIYLQVGSIILLKTLGTIAGLTCFLLLLTNASPSNNVLGALNGLAQTLGAGGRAVGPLMAGGLFSAVHKTKSADIISWATFGAIAATGAVLSLAVKGKHADEGTLETDAETEQEDEEDRN